MVTTRKSNGRRFMPGALLTPGFEQIFHFVDWDRDGKITSAEYMAFEDQLDAYNNPSFPKTNQKGQTREDLLSKRRLGEETKRLSRRRNPTRTRTLCKWRPLSAKEKLARAREMWATLDKNRDKHLAIQ